MKKTTLWLAALALPLVLMGCERSSEQMTEIAQQDETADNSIPQYSAEQFFDTTSISGSSINHDSTAILVSSDQTGVFNAYRYPVDGSDPVQLTDSETDAIFGVSWFPHDDRILYTSDQGGNELNHLFVMEADGSVQDLTPGEDLKADFAGWHEDLTHFYVTSNERDPQAFDLYRYSADDYQRELVMENNYGWMPGAISRDGQWAAMVRSNSSADSDIFLLNLADAEAEPVHVTPHEGNVSHSPYTFSPDNQKLIYGTNEHSEFYEAWAYDLNTGERKPVYSADWDVSFLYYSRNGKYRVVGVNADAQTRLTITNMETGDTVSMPELPAADVGAVSFSRDEQLMAFYLNSDTSPSNLYAWEIGSGAAVQLTDTLSSDINPEHLVASEVVRYESFDGLDIPSLLYKPHQASADNKVPGIIWIHGGPGGQTRKGYSAVRQHLVNHGYAILGANNRGSSGYGKTFFHMDDRRHGDVDLQDIVYGKYYLQSLDWVDPNRIVVMGGSYGGFLTMAALAFTDEFDAGINIFGVTNWVRTLESIPPWWGAFRDALYDEMGNPETDRERLMSISPLFHADRISAPVLIVQGANDPRVLQVESDEMVEAIRENDVYVEYVLFDDEGHGFRSKSNRITAQGAYLEFLQQQL